MKLHRIEAQFGSRTLCGFPSVSLLLNIRRFKNPLFVIIIRIKTFFRCDKDMEEIRVKIKEELNTTLDDKDMKILSKVEIVNGYMDALLKIKFLEREHRPHRCRDDING